MAIKNNAPENKPHYLGRVLVVDDNWITLKLVEAMLTNFGLEVVTVGAGQAALDEISQSAFDLVFLDCSMPELDGHQVAKSIRAREGANRKIKIVAFTADDTIENRQACRASGMDGLLAKPYSYDGMNELLAKYLPLSHSTN